MAHKKSFSGRDLGIDLGTANTLVYVRGEGVVLNEPSVVAVNALGGGVISVGSDAKSIMGRTPSHIVAVRPLRDGVIADFDVAERMLAHFIRKVTSGHRFARPRVVVCVPSGITSVERRAVIEAATTAGARQVYLIDEPMAAALGAGLRIGDPVCSMVVDVGGGTTEVAAIALGGIVTSRSVRVAGDAIDAAIASYVRREYAVVIGEQTAEQVKLAIGSAAPVGYWPGNLGLLDQELGNALPAGGPLSASETRTGHEVKPYFPLGPESPLGPGPWQEPDSPPGSDPPSERPEGQGGGNRGRWWKRAGESAKKPGRTGTDPSGEAGAPEADALVGEDERDPRTSTGLVTVLSPGKDGERRCRIRGRDQVSGLPRTLELDAAQMRHAIGEPVDTIIEAVRQTLDTCPPEAAGDVMERGIVLTGGGALLPGLDVRLGTAFGIPVVIADSPLDCVAIGTGKCVENYEALRTALEATADTYLAYKA